MAATSTAATDPLHTALQEFQDSLTPSQKTELLLLKATPDAYAVARFTAEIDQQNAKRQSRGVASRLYDVLESVRQFTSIIDTCVQANPQVAALVWGSIKITILAVSNFASFFNQLSEWFMELRKICPRFSEYQVLFGDYPGLQTALCSFYATVVRFCRRALEVTQRTGYEHAIKSFLKPFASEFGSFERELHSQSKQVEHQIRLAAEMAADRERKLQTIHRDESVSYWRRARHEVDQAKAWRRQTEEHALMKRKALVLDKISTYDHLAALKQARKKRHGTTSLWLSQTAEYRDWLKDPASSFFWCSGILGAGKTVLTAAIIDDILCRRSSKDNVGYFFCRYDDEKSLTAKDIIGSLIRQALESCVPPTSVELKLTDLHRCSHPDVDDLEPLFGEVITSSLKHFIILDGVDECSKGEKDALLDVLARVFAMPSNNLKLFIASRDSLESDLYSRFEILRHRSMRNSEVQLDIQTYIEETIRDKFKNNHLVLGRVELLFEIRDALVERADGMFLWVYFQIEEICEQQTDEGILRILHNLPKNMNETYERILAKIIDQGKSETAGKVFRWVATVKRPLYLEEIREAIAVEPLQQYMKPERLLNDIGQITSWCRNLIILDEEDQSIRFAHHSTKQFFLNSPFHSRLQEFYINMRDFNHYVGSVCVTYLNFSDFERQLTKGIVREAEVESIDMLKASLASNPDSAFSRSIFKLDKFWRFKSGHRFDLSCMSSYANLDHKAGLIRTLQSQYAFLAYAREHWLAHSSEFTPDTITWNLWESLVEGKKPLADRPWTMTEWKNHSRSISQWIVEKNHYALLSVWFSSLPIIEHNYLTEKLLPEFPSHSRSISDWIVDNNHYALLCVWLSILPVTEQNYLADRISPESPLGKTLFSQPTGSNYPNHKFMIDIALLVATIREDLEAVRELASSPTFRLKAWESNCQALLKAAAIGHSQIVDVLLRGAANKESQDTNGNTAAHLAAAGGHDETLLVLHKHHAWLLAQNSEGLTPIDLARSFCHERTVFEIVPRKYRGWGEWRGYVEDEQPEHLGSMSGVDTSKTTSQRTIS